MQNTCKTHCSSESSGHPACLDLGIQHVWSWPEVSHDRAKEDLGRKELASGDVGSGGLSFCVSYCH